ncbi:hypothetical protein CMV_028981 [Castanea mollissima]|uniref:Uncharacterized protein n=1 Tax=Castanea mollissima TaxID=60419 RepID=A0A8J4Q6F2_9ROSI|nr:hypothetical protein CMV_028981 [Castanea mollissima]
MKDFLKYIYIANQRVKWANELGLRSPFLRFADCNAFLNLIPEAKAFNLYWLIASRIPPISSFILSRLRV